MLRILSVKGVASSRFSSSSFSFCGGGDGGGGGGEEGVRLYNILYLAAFSSVTELRRQPRMCVCGGGGGGGEGADDNDP